MTNQWPQARSLKDDPPPSGSNILLSTGSGDGWYRSICLAGDRLIEAGWTHWLPMPPDPPKLKEPWEVSLDALGYGPWQDTIEARTFKAGWNAALEQVCTFRGFNLNSEQYVLWEQFLNKIKAP